MGLPNKWTDPQHGVCLTLWAAVAHLKAQGVGCETESKAIRMTRSDGTIVRIEAIYLPAAGWVFPVSALEGLISDRS
jgi:phage I-like protein